MPDEQVGLHVPPTGVLAPHAKAPLAGSVGLPMQTTAWQTDMAHDGC